jgi:hypothetical protein
MEKPSLAGVKDEKVLAYIDYLESELKIFTESPHVDSYLSIKRVIDSGNEQIAENKINLFTEKGQEDYKTIGKFTSELKKLEDHLEYLRLKMNPSQKKQLEAKVKEDSLGMAEKIALNGRKRN